jgi:hypothetical protein
MWTFSVLQVPTWTLVKIAGLIHFLAQNSLFVAKVHWRFFVFGVGEEIWFVIMVNIALWVPFCLMALGVGKLQM